MNKVEIRVLALTDAMSEVVHRCNLAHELSRRFVIYLPGNCGRSNAVEQWIFDHAPRLAGAYAFQTLSMGPAEGWERAVEGGIIPVTPFIGGGLRDLVNRGLAKNIRCNLSQVPRLSKEVWKADVAFAHCSEPDRKGRVTLGLNAGLDYTPVKEARFKIAIINKNIPLWHIGVYADARTGKTVKVGCSMHLSEFDLVVRVDEELQTHTMAPKEHQREEINQIAGHILDCLLEETENHALPHTLQLGIGNIPNAVAEAIAERGLSVGGIWTEMFSDGVLPLYNKKLIRGIDGEYLRDKIVVGFVVGSDELYETIRRNPHHFAFVPQEYVNDPAEIRLNPFMCSVNTTLSISLTGEVAAATIGKKLHSDVGGQFDFAYGASLSEGGLAFIALSSTARLRNGAVESKIVAHHKAGAHHTIGADLPVIVVTERGRADLRYLDDADRAWAMIRIADLGWRRHLIKEANKMPALQGIKVMAPRLVTLRNGTRAILRPATSEDKMRIDAYLRQQTEEDLRTRYLSQITIDYLTSDRHLGERYRDDKLDYLHRVPFVMEIKEEIIGVAYATSMTREGKWCEGMEGWYDVSFSRRSDLARQGIGRALMAFVMEWGYKNPDVTHFHAEVLAVNSSMLDRFKDEDFIITRDPDELGLFYADKDMTQRPANSNGEREVA